ncbi:MAG: hypothetical protein M1482_08130, partial [Chloroflexi bacterium]|nr:hypothetical protein [Chloroflexota bacterium]
VAPTDGGGTDGIGTDGGGTDDGATGDGGRATTRVAPTDGGGTDGGANVHDPILGDIVGAWKSISTDEYIVGVHRRNWEPFFRKLWQRNYWEHIVRDDADLARIRAYIVNNPANWESDEHNPKNARDPKGRRL